MSLQNGINNFNNESAKIQQKQEITTHGYDIMTIEPQTTIPELTKMLDRFERTFYEGDK